MGGRRGRGALCAHGIRRANTYMHTQIQSHRRTDTHTHTNARAQSQNNTLTDTTNDPADAHTPASRNDSADVHSEITPRKFGPKTDRGRRLLTPATSHPPHDPPHDPAKRGLA